MKEIKRAVHIDFHTLPGIDDFGKGYSAEDIAKTFEEAKIDYVNFFARCNIGFSYYPTKVGTKYPTLKGNLTGDVINECHKRNIGVTAYLNGGVNHQVLLEHPEYMKINKDGQVYVNPDENMSFFRTPCFNTPYLEHLISEIKEILQMEPDGIFVDCMIPRICYCPSCIKKMKANGINTDDEKEVWTFAVNTLKEAMKAIRETVPEDKYCFINSYPFEDDLYAWVSHAELECLPSFGLTWGYDFFGVQAPYYRNLSDMQMYMTGRFINGWGDFGGIRTKAALENDVFDALLWGYTPSIGDHMHPVFGLDKKLYKEIGEIYTYIESIEEWTRNKKPSVEAAVLRNIVTPETVGDPFSLSDRGVARVLAEMKICFDVINENMEFNKYKLIILPDNIKITDKLYKKLEGFKGAILSSGTSIKKAPVWDYVTEFEPDNNTDAFYKIDGEIFGQYSLGIKMKSNYSIAEYINPYFKLKFNGFHAYRYNPPKDAEGCSAVAVKGNRAHICFNIFEAYLNCSAKFHKDLLNRVIDMIMDERLIEDCELPSNSRVTVMTGEHEDLLNIKVTYPEHKWQRGIIEEHVVVPAGRMITVSGEYKAVYALPEKQKLESEALNGKTRICLPQITGYIPVLLEK